MTVPLSLDTVVQADALEFLKALPDNTIQCMVTSPPYFRLRNYGVAGQLGHEDTVDAYTQRLVDIFREGRRALRSDGAFWLNVGDSYIRKNTGNSNGQSRGELPNKNLMLVPFRLAIALQADGWIVRSTVIWEKTNGLPESVDDRVTNKHEYIFHLTKCADYYHDVEAVQVPVKESTQERWYWGRNGEHKYTDGNSVDKPHTLGAPKENTRKYAEHAPPMNVPQSMDARKSDEINRRYEEGLKPPAYARLRSVWHMSTANSGDEHYAAFPDELPRKCILMSSRPGDLVCDPFMGSGTTARAAQLLGRHFIGCDLNEAYVKLATELTSQPFTMPMRLESETE